MKRPIKTLLNSTIITTVLATSVLSLSACRDEDSVAQKDEIVETSKYMEYRAPEVIRPLSVRTLSGSYLIAQHAQFSNDWKTASKYMDKFLSENYDLRTDVKDNYRKRAMILNLGSGNVDSPLYYAKNIQDSDQNALSLVLRSVPLIKTGKFKEALVEIERVPSGGIADLIKPIIQNWLMFSVGTPPELSKNISAQELYHLVLAADFYSDSDFLKKIESNRVVKSNLSEDLITNIADIMVRHNLTGRALSIYQGLDFEEGINVGVDSKIEKLKNGEDINSEDLFSGLESSSEGIAMAMLSIGTALLQEGGMDSVRVFANLAIALDPTLSDANILLGYVSMEYKKYDEAIEYFSAAIDSDKENYIEIQMQIANVQESAGFYDEAIETLKEVSDREDSIEVQTQIGDISRNNDDYKAALKAYNKAISMIEEGKDEEYWGLFYSRGISQERLGQWDDAEASLQKALKFEPNHPYILNYLGYSWADKGKNLDEALDMIIKAVNLRPNDGYIVDSLGWVYFKLNKFEDSVQPLERAVELMPEDPTLNDHLGDAYWKVGRKHEARFQWNRALNFAEDDPENLSSVEASEIIVQIKEKLRLGL